MKILAKKRLTAMRVKRETSHDDGAWSIPYVEINRNVRLIRGYDGDNDSYTLEANGELIDLTEKDIDALVQAVKLLEREEAYEEDEDF